MITQGQKYVGTLGNLCFGGTVIMVVGTVVGSQHITVELPCGVMINLIA